jgi:hypothetical protein
MIGLASALTPQHASAGAAVAWDGTSGNLATAYGGPVQREMDRALETARRRYGANFRILAASDVTGYGAIAAAGSDERVRCCGYVVLPPVSVMVSEGEIST